MVDEETPLSPEERLGRVGIRKLPGGNWDEAPPGAYIPPITTTPPVAVTPAKPPAPIVKDPDPDTGSGGSQPSYPTPEPVVLDWWQKLAIETRAQLETKLASIASALDIANSVLQETLSRLASLESKPAGKGDKGDKGEPGTNGTNGSNGSNGSNGRDGANGSLFVSTPEFTKIDQRIDLADGKAAIAQSSADIANARNNTQDNSIKQLRDSIANLSSGAPVVPVGPTATEIATAVAGYIKNNPISNGTNGTNGLNGRDGTNGLDGKGVSLVDITAAVNEKINSLDFTDAIRKLLPAPVTTSPVTNIIGVTADDVRTAITAALVPLEGLLTDSEAFVWGMILKANDEFWRLFLDRLETVEFPSFPEENN